MYTIAQKQRFTVINERTKRQYLRMQRRKAAVRKRFYCSVALLAISVLLILEQLISQMPGHRIPQERNTSPAFR